MRKRDLPSLNDLEAMRMPKRYKGSVELYYKYRIHTLKKVLKEIERLNPKFNTYKDFIFGRLTEAEDILDFTDYLKKKGVK